MYEKIALFVLLLVVILIFAYFGVSLYSSLGLSSTIQGAAQTPSANRSLTIHEPKIGGAQSSLADFYEQGIFALGHIGGVKSAGKSYFVEQFVKRYPDVKCYDLDPDMKDVDKMTDAEIDDLFAKVMEKINKFCESNKNSPLLFVGRNYSNNGHLISFHGIHLFIDPPVDTIVSRRAKSENASARDVAIWLDENSKIYQAYSNFGYNFVPFEAVMEKMELVYNNLKYRIKHPKQYIAWVNGPSGCGKTTLMGELRKIKSPNLEVYDVDAMVDTHAMLGVGLDYAHLRKICEERQNKLLVFVGLPINLFGLANYCFAINLDPEENFVRAQRRELENLCKNKPKVMRELKVGNNLSGRLDKMFSTIGHRNPVVLNPDDGIGDIYRMRTFLDGHKFVFMSADEIYSEVKFAASQSTKK